MAWDGQARRARRPASRRGSRAGRPRRSRRWAERRVGGHGPDCGALHPAVAATKADAAGGSGRWAKAAGWLRSPAGLSIRRRELGRRWVNERATTCVSSIWTRRGPATARPGPLRGGTPQGCPRGVGALMCRKRSFATHADRLRPRLEYRRLPIAGPAARRPAGRGASTTRPTSAGRRGPDELAFERTTAVAASTSSSAPPSRTARRCAARARRLAAAALSPRAPPALRLARTAAGSRTRPLPPTSTGGSP